MSSLSGKEGFTFVWQTDCKVTSMISVTPSHKPLALSKHGTGDLLVMAGWDATPLTMLCNLVLLACLPSRLSLLA